jgi:hypothetical protein
MKDKLRVTLKITLAVVLLSVVLAGSLSIPLNAMSWPSEDAVLLRNFGFNDGGRPVLGMVFGGGTGVLAAEKGEVIFTFDINDKASRLPSPLGAWTAVDHGDGLISIYSRYANESVSLTQAEKSQQIASAGTSGWSQRDGFYFLIFDRRERHWINPAMLITPVMNTYLPQILSVSLIDNQGIRAQSNNLSQGRYTILVNAGIPPSNAAAQGLFLAPQKIICLINGAETGSLNLEAFSARDGVLVIYRNGLIPAKQVYGAFPAFEAADVFFSRGQVNMEIIVQDIAGNSRNFANRLIVN